MLRALALGLVASLMLPIAVASHGDDAGSGRDAGGDLATALPISLDAIEGSLDPAEGDAADWYVVNVPIERQAFVVNVVAGEMDLGLEVRASNGEVLRVSDNAPICDERGCWDGEEVGVFWKGGPLYVGVHARAGRGDYTLAFDVREPSNARLIGLRVVEHPARVGTVDLPMGTRRTIEATVLNEGPGVSYAGWVAGQVSHDLGGHRELKGSPVPDLAPGEIHVTVLEWDGTGEIGDVTVHAGFGSILDLDPSDNARSTRASVLAGNVGVGADLLNHGIGHCEPEMGCASVFHEWNSPARGPRIRAFMALANVVVNGGTRAGTMSVEVWIEREGQFTFVDAGTQNGRLFANVCDSERAEPDCRRIGGQGPA